MITDYIVRRIPDSHYIQPVDRYQVYVERYDMCATCKTKHNLKTEHLATFISEISALQYVKMLKESVCQP